ncbi:transposase, partial [Pseudomonas aeruginosa]
MLELRQAPLSIAQGVAVQFIPKQDQFRESAPIFRFCDLPPPDFSTMSNLVESVFRAGDGSEKAFTEEQTLDFLKQAEAGVPVKKLCRRHGFSDASFYTWRA